jgi:hypothetical protein
MDFVRERRQWEDEMRRRAMVEAEAEAGSGNDEGDADADMLERGPDQEELSPTEQYDLDELVRDYRDVQGDLARDDANGLLVDDDEEEYEELFRGLISQGLDEALNRSTNEDIGHQTGSSSDPGSHHGTRERYGLNMDLS